MKGDKQEKLKVESEEKQRILAQMYGKLDASVQILRKFTEDRGYEEVAERALDIIEYCGNEIYLATIVRATDGDVVAASVSDASGIPSQSEEATPIPSQSEGATPESEVRSQESEVRSEPKKRIIDRGNDRRFSANKKQMGRPAAPTITREDIEAKIKIDECADIPALLTTLLACDARTKSQLTRFFEIHNNGDINKAAEGQVYPYIAQAVKQHLGFPLPVPMASRRERYEA